MWVKGWQWFVLCVYLLVADCDERKHFARVETRLERMEKQQCR